VFREGDEGQSVFLVLRGEVRLSSAAGTWCSRVAHKGELFGEASW